TEDSGTTSKLVFTIQGGPGAVQRSPESTSGQKRFTICCEIPYSSLMSPRGVMQWFSHLGNASAGARPPLTPTRSDRATATSGAARRHLTPRRRFGVALVL